MGKTEIEIAVMQMKPIPLRVRKSLSKVIRIVGVFHFTVSCTKESIFKTSNLTHIQRGREREKKAANENQKIKEIETV